jgi:tol-pal system protein YbgF
MVLLAALAAVGCGARASGSDSGSALTARIDLIEVKSKDQSEHLQDMSMRITELENLVLKQANEIKKLKGKLDNAPKVLTVVAEADSTATGAAWDKEPIYAQATEDGTDGETWSDGEMWTDAQQDEEDRPLLKLYGSPGPDPLQVPSQGQGVTLTPASLLTDTSGLGTFVPMNLPPLDDVLPKVDATIGGTGSGTKKAVDPYEQGVFKYDAKEWSSAILYFDIYLKHDPSGSKALDALFLKAESLYQMKNYLEAIGQFELVLERYPNSSRATSAMLRIGRCYEKLGDKSKASSIYKELVLSYPGTSQAKKAGKLLEALK